MVLPGHLAGGYLAARAVLFLTHASFPPGQTTALLAIGTLAGELPDIDLVFFYFEHTSDKPEKIASHRDYITHVPLFWLAVSLVISSFGLLGHSAFIGYLGLMILAGTWSHFLLDSIAHGVRWLYPFTGKRFCLRERPHICLPEREGTLAHHWHYMRSHYVKNISFYAEILIVIAAICVLIR